MLSTLSPFFVNMKNNNKQNRTIFIAISILIVIGCIFCIFHISKNSKNENGIRCINFKKGFYYRITPWNKLEKGTNLYYEYQELTEESISSAMKTKIVKKDEEKNIDGEIIKADKDVVDEKKIFVREPWAQIFASLTGSAGSLGISGSSRNADIYFNDVNRGKNFSGGAGSSFTVFIDSGNNDRTVSISSPAFAVNSTVKSLSIGIDPYSMYMTLSGHVELDLPGDIVGTLYNTSNGSSGGATLNNGYFSVNVPLSYGVNNITASGKWMTIELQLPTISVNISK